MSLELSDANVYELSDTYVHELSYTNVYGLIYTNVCELSYTNVHDWDGYHESERCSRDTYPESSITKYTNIRRKDEPTSHVLAGV